MDTRQKLDLLAIGDITTDAFIRLKEAHVTCDINRENCQICMDFAAKIPYEFVEIVRAVGNAANAAVSVARLGLSSGLIANIGDDEHGRECVLSLKKEGVDTSAVRAHRGAKTNYHYVLWYEAERTILVKHEAYPYTLPEFEAPQWLYVSSLGENTFPYHEEIARYVEDHPDVLLAFQPGTFQIHAGFERLHTLYSRSHVFVCNKEEAQKILASGSESVPELLHGLRALGPRMVVLTDGPKGAYLSLEQDDWFMPPYPDPKPPAERTGAGDAYASTFVGALALGKTPMEALFWAPVNSMSVVQYIGAQKGLLNRTELEELLKSAPPDYRPQKI